MKESKVLCHLLAQTVKEKANRKRRGNPFSVLSCTHQSPCSSCKPFTIQQLTKALLMFVISLQYNMIIGHETKGKKTPSGSQQNLTVNRTY